MVHDWRGVVANYAEDEHDALGWFAGEELGPLELANSPYLGLLSTVLAGGKARIMWSDDGGSVTKTLVPGVVIPQWASLLGRPRRAALNELRVNRLLNRVRPPVKRPTLTSGSTRGPSMTFETVNGAPLGPKFPQSLTELELADLVQLAVALGSYQPRRPWFRRLYIERRLLLHCRSGLINPSQADTLARFAGSAPLKWGFAHGDITARNVLKDADGHLSLIDWEWAGLYPIGYELAFLWFSLADVPGGRARVEAIVPPGREAGFLLSAALVSLLTFSCGCAPRTLS